jgi:hypothetical protein
MGPGISSEPVPFRSNGVASFTPSSGVPDCTRAFGSVLPLVRFLDNGRATVSCANGQMENFELAGVGIYSCIAVVFAITTYFEGWGRRDGWDRDRVVGLLSCTVWPLLIATILIGVLSAKRRDTVV